MMRVMFWVEAYIYIFIVTIWHSEYTSVPNPGRQVEDISHLYQFLHFYFTTSTLFKPLFPQQLPSKQNKIVLHEDTIWMKTFSMHRLNVLVSGNMRAEYQAVSKVKYSQTGSTVQEVGWWLIQCKNQPSLLTEPILNIKTEWKSDE